MKKGLIAWMFLAFLPLAAIAEESRIHSVSILGDEILVSVSAPVGARKVSLEGRSRVIGSAWTPRAIRRFLDPLATATLIEFRVTRTENLEIIRVRSDASEALPGEFFSGPSDFREPFHSSVAGRFDSHAGLFPGTSTTLGTSTSTGATTSTGSSTSTGSGTTTAGGTSTGTTTGTSTGGGTTTGEMPRAVVESDIWKIRGDSLYFFNQLRGLQAIDISAPAAPSLRGAFALPALGEQMYLLASDHAVLLARPACESGYDRESKLVVVDAVRMQWTGEIRIPGRIKESRLVGNVVYIASEDWRPNASAPSGWQMGTTVISVDLSIPSAPAIRRSLFFPGAAQTIAATDRFLFIATALPSDPIRSEVQVIDINSSSGQMEERGAVAAAGQVADKFKINLDGEILSLVSHKWDPVSRWITTLENFSLADPSAPEKLGQIKLAQGEQLFATRFDGNRVYIVTYLRIDPLWIVDNSNPSAPAIRGELHVPGWSTYLRPMGDRVVAMGIDDTASQRVAVSLFDVSDPGAPALLSKVIMGASASWSEANSDEKAVAILPEERLALAPFQSASGAFVQLIDLDRDKLTARGTITNQFYARRATLHRNHILSISGRELLSFDASDRARPELKARLELAWKVDRVIQAGDHLLQFETSPGADARLWISTTAAPEIAVPTAAFPSGFKIAGWEKRDGRLFVALTRSGEFQMSVWDLSRLPMAVQLSQTSSPAGVHLGAVTDILWPKENLLVWTDGDKFLAFDVSDPNSPRFESRVDLNVAATSRAFAADGLVFASHRAADGTSPLEPEPADQAQIRLSFFQSLLGPYTCTVSLYGGTTGTFVLSEGSTGSGAYTYTTTSDWTATLRLNFAGEFAGDSDELRLHFTSRQFDGVQKVGSHVAPCRGDFIVQSGALLPGEGGGLPRYVRSCLDVIDFADPANPVVRQPVSIPGNLVGISHRGEIIYTVGQKASPQGDRSSDTTADASAYDGVSAHLVASIILPPPFVAVTHGADVFVAVSAESDSLRRWRLAESGAFQFLSQFDFGEPLYDLEFRGDSALARTRDGISRLEEGEGGQLLRTAFHSFQCGPRAPLRNAEISADGGLWIAAGDFGVTWTPPARLQ